jgi:DNA-binding transcriptional MerR regulator
MKKEFLANKQTLDQEWVDLILAALDMGMTVQEIKEFFSRQSSKEINAI